jgi:hypothetical protein
MFEIGIETLVDNFEETESSSQTPIAYAVSVLEIDPITRN